MTRERENTLKSKVELSPAALSIGGDNNLVQDVCIYLNMRTQRFMI